MQAAEIAQGRDRREGGSSGPGEVGFRLAAVAQGADGVVVCKSW